MKKLIYGFIVFNLICFQVKEAQGHWRIDPCGELCEECGTRLSWYGKPDSAKARAHHRNALCEDLKKGNLGAAKNHSYLGTILWDIPCGLFLGTYYGAVAGVNWAAVKVKEKLWDWAFPPKQA